MGRKTLSVQDTTKETFDELKPTDASQDDFLHILLEAYQTQDTNQPEDRTDEILNRLDDLQAELPRKTAEELSRLR